MNKAEKIRLKAGVAKELVDLIYKRKDHEHEAWVEGKGALKALELVLARQVDISNSLDKQLDADEIKAEQYKVAKNTAANMIMAVSKALKGIEAEMAKVKPRQEMADRIIKDMDNWYAQRMNQADGEELRQTEIDAEEADPGEIAKREARAARIKAEKGAEVETQPENDEPSGEKEPEPPKEEKPEPKKRQTRKKTSRRKASATKKSDTEGLGGVDKQDVQQSDQGPPTCAHTGCDNLVDPPTGTSYCSPCVSYKNKHKKLPPAEVLAKRKK